MARFKVTTVHGEYGTIFHVIDTAAKESDQPAIVASYSTGSGFEARKCASRCRDAHNAAAERNKNG